MSTEKIKENHSKLLLAVEDYTEYLKKMACYLPKEDCVKSLEIAKSHDKIYQELDLTNEKVKKTLISLAEFVIEHCLFKNKLEYSPFKNLNYINYRDFFPEMINKIKIKDDTIFDFIYGYREEVFNDFFSIYGANSALKDKISERLPLLADEKFNKLFSVRNKSSFYEVYYNYADKNSKFDVEKISFINRLNILNDIFSHQHMSWRDRYKLPRFIDDITRINNKRRNEVIDLLFSSSDSNDFFCDLLSSKKRNENMFRELSESINLFGINLFKKYIIRECKNNTNEDKIIKGNLISRIIIQNKNNESLSFLLEEENFLLSSNLFFKNGENLKNAIFSKPNKKELSNIDVENDIKNIINSKFMLLYIKELYSKYNKVEKDMIERNEKEMAYFSKNIFRSNNYRLILSDMVLFNDMLKHKMLKKMINVDIKSSVKKKRI